MHRPSSEYHLPTVTPATIAQVEAQDISLETGLREFRDTNIALITQILIEATKDFPDLNQRERALSLTMRALRIVEGQQIINALEASFSVNLEETVVPQEVPLVPPAA